MFTYAIYNFILLGSTWVAYLYEKSESRNSQVVFLLISFFIPFLFLAVRYDVGQDYHNYIEYFYKIASGAIVLKEPGYLFVNYAIAYFGLDVQWLFVFFGFFTMLFVYKALPRDGFALFLFLMIISFYLYSYTALRQSLVMAIMLYASKYICEKRFWMYLFWAVVGMMFHITTALLLLIIYPIVNKKFNRFLLMGTIFFFTILVFSTNLLHSLVESIVLLFPKYAWYLNSKYMLPANTSAGLIGPLLKVIIGLIVIFFKDKIILKYPEANIVINLYVLFLLGSIFRLDIGIFNRMEETYMLYFILSIGYFLKTFNNVSRVIIMYIILLFYYLMFARYIHIATVEIDNGIHVRPYETILDRR
jgi:hypothetical protein